MPYTIGFSASAEREFKSLDRSLQRRIGSRVEALATNPYPPGARKLQAGPDLFRIRVGDYRVIYRVDGKQVTVLIVKIGHRREVYRQPDG